MISFSLNCKRKADILIAPISLLVILLLGYYRVFFGDTFFVEEDPSVVKFYHSQNVLSNGWRPDLGIGGTFFFGDPGLFHSWGLFRWWDQFFPNSLLAYNCSVLILLWVATLAVYHLLKRIIPDIGIVPQILLASLIAFSPLRNEFFFQRHWIVLSIVTVPISFILYDFIKGPSLRHYFQYTLTLCSSLFLGSFAILYQGLIFAVIFFVILILYKDLHRSPGELWVALKRFFLLNLASGLTMVLLGAWVFYSLFLEKFLVGYVRDPNYSNDVFFSSMTLQILFERLFGYFHAGIFSHWTGVLGMAQTFRIQEWNMVSPLFPIVLLFSFFYKSRNFWEFASKCVVLGFLIYQELVVLIPGILEIIQSFLNLYPPSKFHPIIHVYEIILIGIFLNRLQSDDYAISLRGLRVTRVAGFLNYFIYSGLVGISCFAVATPQALASILHFLSDWFSQFIHIPTNAKAVLPGLISGNVRLFNETMGAKDILFYGMTFTLALLFVTPYWANILKLANGRIFAGLILTNSILLVWTVYPMNKESLIWDRQNKNGVNLSEIFKPTDRIARLGVLGCRSSSDFIACTKERILKGEFGPRRYNVGYLVAPTLDFSGVKSFTSKEVALMMDEFMRREGKYEKGYRRTLQLFHNFFPLRLFDFSAVNYFLSENRQPENEQLELIHASKQFYVYKNLNAWPYFYLADRIEHIQNFGDLYDAEKGIAYLWKDSDSFIFPEKNGKSKGRVELEKFEFGEMVFQADSQEEEVLVVMDAWHPNWRAEIDGDEADVIKTNGVFKGVRLPAGKHKLHFFFDSSPYLPGVWISLVSWIVFLGAWYWKSKNIPAK
jgi:hypothetical protein